jgi:hypothetical protein
LNVAGACNRLLLAPLVAVSICAMSAGAQPSGGAYRIERGVIAGGGGSLSGGTFQLRGTFGQSTTAPLTGSGYGFYGGFWPPNFLGDRIYADAFDH